jgi:hypothetical protein
MGTDGFKKKFIGRHSYKRGDYNGKDRRNEDVEMKEGTKDIEKVGSQHIKRGVCQIDDSRRSPDEREAESQDGINGSKNN